ncbi:MAG: hypothetical protein Q7R63_01160 [bacterium]|nr:hypothetical protein [bacterium]
MSTKSKKERGIAMRIQGKSYGEIMKALEVSSKGTIAYWFRDIELSAEAKDLLKGKMELARQRNLIDFNIKRTQAIVQENTAIRLESAKHIGKLSKRELLLIGTALYWGEGTTRELVRGYQRVGFSNSNPDMIKIFMRYAREILKVEEAHINVEVSIHPNIEEKDAEKFWSKITNIPFERVYIFTVVSPSGTFKRPKNFLPHGTANIRIYKRRIFYAIKGFIDGINKSLNA